MAAGFLVKRAKNGIVVIEERFVNTPQGVMSNFSVDEESTSIFPAWGDAANWLGTRLVPPAPVNSEGTVTPIRPPA